MVQEILSVQNQTLPSSALADTMRSHISYQTAKSGPLTLTHLLSMSKVSDDADGAWKAPTWSWFTIETYERKCKKTSWHISQIGSRDSLLVKLWTCDREVESLNPGRSHRWIFFSRVNFVCGLLFSVSSTPVLPQWHIIDPGYSAKSAGSMLHVNMHTPWTDTMKPE